MSDGETAEAALASNGPVVPSACGANPAGDWTIEDVAALYREHDYPLHADASGGQVGLEGVRPDTTRDSDYPEPPTR